MVEVTWLNPTFFDMCAIHAKRGLQPPSDVHHFDHADPLTEFDFNSYWTKLHIYVHVHSYS